VQANTPSDAHPEVPVAKGKTSEALRLSHSSEAGLVIANFLADSVKFASLNKLRFGFAH